MEELLEAGLAIAVILFALVRKAKKAAEAQKEKDSAKPAQTMPQQDFQEAFETEKEQNAHEKAAAVKTAAVKAAVKAAAAAKQVVMDELLQLADEEEKPSLEHAPLHVAPVMPAAVIPPVTPIQMVSKEGDCIHAEHVPMERHMPKADEPESMEKAPAKVPVSSAKRRFDAQEMRRAVVAAEILGRPAAMRKRGR